MNVITKTIFGAALGAAVSLSACGKGDREESKAPTKVAKATAPARASAPVKSAAPAEAEKAAAPAKAETQTDTTFAAAMMKSYEDCRKLLSADKTEGISDCATGIVTASKDAHAGAPKAAHKAISALVKAAEALSKVPADDIEAVRLAFGEVSKSTVAMLTAAPEAAKNYHVFECAMAKGYKSWAQSDATLANPYMGTKMTGCGEETHAHHAGMNMGGDAPKMKMKAGMKMPAGHGSMGH